MIEQLLNVEYGYFWLCLGVILVILETLGAAFALVSLGVGAILTGVVAFMGILSFTWLLALFAIVSLATFGLTRPLLNRITATGNHIKTNVEALVGRVGIVSQPIAGKTSPGYVKASGDEWRALSLSGEPIAQGTEVEIRKMEGATVFVVPHAHVANEKEEEA
jgi:membrane protein implicated in regulation of membrane protease activity